jgi:hypothetical protein
MVVVIAAPYFPHHHLLLEVLPAAVHLVVQILDLVLAHLAQERTENSFASKYPTPV